MLLFPMNVLLECLMFIKLILAKVTTQKQEDKLWTMGEECLFRLHTHYLSFITQWKHDFFSPVSLILFTPGNNASFYSVPLATNGRLVPYNGKIALLEKNTNKNKYNLCLQCHSFCPHWQQAANTWNVESRAGTQPQGGGCCYSQDGLPQALFSQLSRWKHLRMSCMRQQLKLSSTHTAGRCYTRCRKGK